MIKKIKEEFEVVKSSLAVKKGMKLINFLTGERMLAIYTILIALWTISFVRKQWSIEDEMKKNDFAHSTLYLNFTVDDKKEKEVNVSYDETIVYDSDETSIRVSGIEEKAKTRQIKLPEMKFQIKSGRILNVYSIISDFRHVEKIVETKIILSSADEIISESKKAFSFLNPEIKGFKNSDGRIYFYSSILIKGTGDRNYLFMQAYDGKKQYLIDDVVGLSTHNKDMPQIFYDEYQALRKYLIESGVSL